MTTKLVEVALPLEAISLASRRDKDRKTGTIKNVHKWFAPMPTPAWRALLFAALVDDPGEEAERAKLLDLVARLVPEHGGAPDEVTLAEARAKIIEATGGDPPPVFDPFCGGGSTLVEAQRLGLRAIGSDLNPVPVLITRVLTELVPQVAGRPPLVGDPAQLGRMSGGPLDGFLADCAYYARRVRDVVWEQIGHLYPEAPGGGTIIAWLWARTVTCPNPACRAVAPLATSFWLSKKKGAETWVEPNPQGPGKPVRFAVRRGKGGPRSGTVARTAARCLTCSESIPLDHVRSEGRAGRNGFQLMAAAVEGAHCRRYVSGNDIEVLGLDRPEDTVDIPMPAQALGFRVQIYGMTNYADLFTNRQLTALATFADSIRGVPEWVMSDQGDEVQSVAISSVLGLCLGKMSAAASSQVRWRLRAVESKAEPAFGRHALPMVWDFAETNPFGGSVGDWLAQTESVMTGLRAAATKDANPAHVVQADARTAAEVPETRTLLATDPPYFAHIGYADLSDYFYIWLRRALANVHPDLFATVSTPKSNELISAPYRHGGDSKAATSYFIEGFTEAFRNLAKASAPGLPMMIVYAHRQEENGNGNGSTGWDAMLTAIIDADLRIVGTWPIHATGTTRQIGLGTNAVASYMVLVCRPQVQGAKTTDRQGFMAALRADLPRAVKKLQEGAISSIDLGQATIGPGMAIFSRFAKVWEPTGQAMTVHSALKLIAQVQSEVLDEFAGDVDASTRWAMLWYRDHGFGEGPFGDAEKLFKTTNTSLDGLERAGIVASRSSKVRLLGRDDLPGGWDPGNNQRLTVWGVTQHLTKCLASGGEQEAAGVLATAIPWADEARNLLYWLSATAVDRWPKDALDYEALITSWPELVRLAHDAQGDGDMQLRMGS